MRSTRVVVGLVAIAALGLVAGAHAQPTARPALPTVPVEIGGESFALEVAVDPMTQYRGLGGRRALAPDGGMIFLYRASRPLAFVMRDCRIPIDIAFLDATGRVISTHEMKVEPPRRTEESPREYEARLPQYPSGLPARYAIEVAGGRLAALGVRPGQRIELPREALAAALRE
ncbi:MAG: DUF192 domain-containing protein [Myxococcota bacterium]|nr:DUF192 domain-containing protein [Myxococcota bacterium]